MWMNEGKVVEREKQSRLMLWLPVIVWLSLIFIASSIHTPFRVLRVFRYQDKLIHLVEFGILGALLARAVYRKGLESRWRYWACIGAASLYGALDEFHQAFVPGRSVDWSDFAADSFGAFIFVWVWLSLKGQGLLRLRERVRKTAE